MASNVTVLVPRALRDYCGCAKELNLSAASVRDALSNLEQEHPALYRSICDETGRVRPHVNVFVNSAHMRDRDGLDTPLQPGDVLMIMPAVSGG